MSLVNKLIDQIKGLRRSSMLRLSLLLSVIFAIGFAVAISVALILGQDAIERRVDATLTTLARTAVLEDARVASVAALWICTTTGYDRTSGGFWSPKTAKARRSWWRCHSKKAPKRKN